jgi:hypothetical protein
MVRNKTIFSFILLVLVISVSLTGCGNMQTSQELDHTSHATITPATMSTEQPNDTSIENTVPELSQPLPYEDFQLLIPRDWTSENSTPPNLLPVTFKRADDKTVGRLTLLQLDAESDIDRNAEVVTSFKIDQAKVYKGTQTIQSIQERYVLIYVPEKQIGYSLSFNEEDITEQLALAIAATFSLR